MITEVLWETDAQEHWSLLITICKIFIIFFEALFIRFLKSVYVENT